METSCQGVPFAGLSLTKDPHAWGHRLGIGAQPLGGLGTLSRSQELKMAPWELTGKVRREERDHGVRKLPVPGAGWALQTPRRYSRCGGREQGQTEEERKCTWEENTQNLRHQTDKEVAFWGQRNTEEAPREALRHTSRISPARLAHSDHPANTFRQEWRDDNVSCAQTHSSQRHVDLEDKDGTARLHRVQSNPGDKGVTWELLGQTYCPTMAGLGRDKMETKHVTLRGQVYPCHPLQWVDIQEGIQPVVPGHSPQGLKPSASLVHHSQAVGSSDVPGGVMKRRSPAWGMYLQTQFHPLPGHAQSPSTNIVQEGWLCLSGWEQGLFPQR